jgi:hypothetical protein
MPKHAKLYLIPRRELKTGDIDQALWDEALLFADGEQLMAERRYVDLRIRQLVDEIDARQRSAFRQKRKHQAEQQVYVREEVDERIHDFQRRQEIERKYYGTSGFLYVHNLLLTIGCLAGVAFFAYLVAAQLKIFPPLLVGLPVITDALLQLLGFIGLLLCLFGLYAVIPLWKQSKLAPARVFHALGIVISLLGIAFLMNLDHAHARYIAIGLMITAACSAISLLYLKCSRRVKVTFDED